MKVPRWDGNMKQPVLDCVDQNRSSNESRKEIMIEGEFNFLVPGNMLYHHERSEDTRLDDTFPLLSSDRGYNHLSPMSRLRRIEEGRKELMEMIRDMPESCCELSLKDIVVEQKKGAEGPTSCPAGTEAEVNNKQRKNNNKRRMKDASVRPGEVTRTGSMEAGSFLIRMFLPAFLMSSKKPMSGYRSKTPLSSPRASLDWSDRREISKDLKVGRWPFPREERSHEGTSRSNSCTSRIENSGFLSGCWPFGGSNNSKGKVMKGKMIRQKTCIF